MMKGLILLAWLNGSVLSDIFLNQGAPYDRAIRVSKLVLHESRRRHTDPLMVAAIISVENPRLVPDAVSSAGALGIMQVMPLWKTSGFRGCGSDLTHDRTNLCYGVQVWRFYVARSDGYSRALLAYNGCVRSPGCTRYAPLVWNRYILFRYQASLVKHRSFQDNLIWRLSEHEWNRDHHWLNIPQRLVRLPVQEAGGGRRSARGAPGVRAAIAAAPPLLVRRNGGAPHTSHNPFSKE